MKRYVLNPLTGSLDLVDVAEERLFIQPTAPTTDAETYMWWQTTAVGGDLVTLWVETGASGAPGGASGPDQAPQGDWVGVYGGDGYYLMAWDDGGVDVDGLTVADLAIVSNLAGFQFSSTTGDVRALENAAQSVRKLGTYYTPDPYSLGVLTLTFPAAWDGTIHTYCCDWETTTRRENVGVDDGVPMEIDITASFNAGAWCHFPVSVGIGGVVTISVANTVDQNAVISGLFLDAV